MDVDVDDGEVKPAADAVDVDVGAVVDGGAAEI